MDQHFVVVILFYALSLTESGLINGDKDGLKDSVVVSVESKPDKFVLKSQATRGNNWQSEGVWKSKKDYAVELMGRTLHETYLLSCYKPKARGNSKAALYFNSNELIEVEVTTCDEAKVWSAIRILDPKQGYHHISVLLKTTCKEYQVNMQTSIDNNSVPCQRNAGNGAWEKVG